ncbi:MAG: hypothetical protein CSA62_00180 [Planctomycetota bacterium]|nr:MAG: hypothetical protein CSA62_00180 [Planctomycetota bacterium]
MRSLAIVLLSLFLTLLSCRSNTWAEPRDPKETNAMLSGRDAPGPGQIELEQTAPSMPFQEASKRFVQQLLQAAPKAGSILCLPAVTQDHRHGVRATELGVELADVVAKELRRQKYPGLVLGTLDAQLMAAKSNLSRATLSSLPAIRQHGARFGADIISFGSIKVTRNSGSVGRNTLGFSLIAYDVLGERVLVQENWKISNQTPGSAYEWTRLDQPSPWLPDSGFAAPGAAPKLSQELQIASHALARRMKLALGKISGKAYVAPLDSSEFVKALAYLRSAQAIFAQEYETRLRLAAGAKKPAQLDKPLTIHGTQFPNLQAAQAYLGRLEESLQASPSSRFGEMFTLQLLQALRSELGSSELSLSEIGATDWSDRQLVEGQLALGGLARSKKARGLLKQEGYKLVLQPRLDKLGKEYLLRVLAFDVEGGETLGSAFFPLQEGFGPELAELLGSQEEKAPKQLPKVAPRQQLSSQTKDWSEVYQQAVKASVMVASKKGWGSGFFVGKDLVLTNFHVIDKVSSKDDPLLLFADGSKSRYKVLNVDKRWDIALLAAARVPAGTKALRLAKSAQAAVGKAVAVLGRPKQTLGWVLSPGYLSSLSEISPITKTKRWMYTCPTRGGNSGSPVLLTDGTVVALHSEGSLGNLAGSKSFTELTGFARGVPVSELRTFLQKSLPKGR